MKYAWLVWVLILQTGHAQPPAKKDTSLFLTAHPAMLMQSINAVNDLYDFQFEKAEAQFEFLKEEYGWHPLPHFLMGLSQWWKLMPGGHDEVIEKKFLNCMDKSIEVAEELMKNSKEYKIEAAFFLAGAHGFKSHFYSEEENRNWTKAAFQGKTALRYLNMCSENNYLSPELLFGDGLYNYFSVWVPENYPILRLLFRFMKKGDKKLGIKQLQEVSANAIYTRVEAMIWLMRIQNAYENNQAEAFRLAEYLHQTFPHNPYFHRYYVRMLYQRGFYTELEKESLFLLQQIEAGVFGFEATTGRYASFFLGQYYQHVSNEEEAKKYYKKTIEFAEKNNSLDSGYSLYAMLSLGEIALRQRDKEQAEEYFKKIKKLTGRKDALHKSVKQKLKDMEREK